MIGENFQMSASHVSSHVTLVDKYIKKTAAAELGELSKDSKNKLARLGYPVTRRRRHEDTDSGEDDTEEEGRRTHKTRRR